MTMPGISSPEPTPGIRRLSVPPELLLSLAALIGLFILNQDRAWATLSWEELHTAQSVGLGWLDLVKDRYWQGHSPLYFAIEKLWLLCASWLPGTLQQSELTFRIPSLLTASVAGGFLAGAAWRAWAPLAGILFIALWIASPLIGYFAFDARPYGLLLLALSVGIWSNVRLWRRAGNSEPDASERGHRALWVTSVVLPTIAAATIPVGIIAVLTIEIGAASMLLGRPGKAFARCWLLRMAIVAALLLAVAAILMPAIHHKSAHYWTEQFSPFSAATILSLLKTVMLQNVAIAGFALLALGVAGLYLRRDVLARMAAGLALLFPAVMIAASTGTSLLTPRYFLPTVPGLYLLAAGAAGERFNGRSVFAGIVIIAISILIFIEQPQPSSAYDIRQEMELLENHHVSQITGGVTSGITLSFLDYYIPWRLGFVPDLTHLSEPPQQRQLPKGELYWLFIAKRGAEAGKWVAGLPVICRFDLENTNVYVLGRDVATPPPNLAGCPRQ